MWALAVSNKSYDLFIQCFLEVLLVNKKIVNVVESDLLFTVLTVLTVLTVFKTKSIFAPLAKLLQVRRLITPHRLLPHKFQG